MVKIVYEADKSRYAAYDGNKNIGEATFIESNGVLEIDHTEVDKAYDGKEITSQLVEEVVKRARESGAKILPLCPFSKVIFEEHSEFEDVLKK